jgi:hypothetical protein
MDLSQLDQWATPLVGIVFAGIILAAGSRLMWTRRAALAPPPPSSEPDPFICGGALEKRTSARRKGHATRVLLANGNRFSPAAEGWIVDRSMGGLRISVGSPVALQSVLRIRAVDAPESAPWVEIQVRCCQASEDRWELGCQFASTPAWSVLLQFR